MKISKLCIDPAVVNLPETIQVQERLQAPEVVIVSPAEVFQEITASTDSVAAGKQVLLLTANKGSFLKPCPGTSCYRCCGYQILNIGRFCTMDCSYCILQAYFHPPLLQYYVNREDMEAELNVFLDKSNRVLRIGTGEFTDSLIWEECTDLSQFLVARFARQTKAVLELKSKTVNIEALETLEHNRKTIVSWSLNTEAVMASEERGTTTLDQRLAAAARCESWGYPLAFHFDPMVLYDGCDDDYAAVVEKIFASVAADNIVWISLGSFRFMPELKTIIQQRFPDSKIIYGEFITGLDRKVRYFKPLRINLYKKIIDRIRQLAPQVLIYFCMEDDEVWEKCLGFTPGSRGGLPRLLDQSAAHHCGLDQGLL